MYKLYILVVCTLFVKLSSAALERWPPQEKPAEFADQEGCYIPILNRVLAYNVPYSPQDGTTCDRYTCEDNGVTIRATCGVIEAGPNCTITEGNKFLPYPDCCDGVKCNEVDSNDLY